MSIAVIAAGLLLAADTPPPPAAAPEAAAGLISAFGAVCLEHLGDTSAQMAAARAAPWNYAPNGETEDHLTRFRSELGTLGVREEGKICTVTEEIDSHTSLPAFQAAMSTSMPLGDGTALEPGRSVYWLIAQDGSNEQFVISLKVSAETGRNLATLWVQSRGSLHQ